MIGRYEIKRENWNEKTSNGYVDNPYWLIKLYGNSYGLTDEGKLWSIDNLLITKYTIEKINVIIKECKLNIKIQTK